MDAFYTMQKSAWDARLGDYSAIEISAGPLTLREVRARVSRLPDTTNWLWTIDKRSGDIDGFNYIVGSTTADEFDGDVENTQ